MVPASSGSIYKKRLYHNIRLPLYWLAHKKNPVLPGLLEIII